MGFVIISWGNLMIGGSNFATLNRPGTAESIFVGLSVSGLAGGMVTIPIIPEMIEVYEQDSFLSQEYERSQVETFISACFVTCAALGEILGPLVSS